MYAGDTLNGHQDNVEPDLSQPIVAMSVGCDAVFLIGGRTKAEKPTALLLSSGDVVVMTSAARLCVHGVQLEHCDQVHRDRNFLLSRNLFLACCCYPTWGLP